MPCFGDDPVAEPRRQKDKRTNYSADLLELWLAEPRGAAGGRIIIIRRERPSSIVRPEPESCPFRFGVVSLGPVYGLVSLGPVYEWHPLSPSTSGSAAQAAPAGRLLRGSVSRPSSACQSARPSRTRAGNKRH
jgi:hypothetical protein